MRILRLIGAMLISLFLLGCISGSHTYDAPGNIPPIKNTITLNQSKDATWKQLLTGLSQSFFVINNVEKASGLINVSFSGNPEDFVDCGTLHCTVTNARGTRNYTFPAASQDKKFEVVEQGHLFFLHRQLNLEGRINILVTEIGPNQSTVSVNTKYVLLYKNTVRDVRGHIVAINEKAINFTTNDKAKFPDAETTCRPTGLIERRIIDIVDPRYKKQ